MILTSKTTKNSQKSNNFDKYLEKQIIFIYGMLDKDKTTTTIQ